MKPLPTVTHQSPFPHATAFWPSSAVIGARLRIGRVIRKLELEDVAKATGVLVGTLDLYEHGRAEISASLAVRLCDLYGIDLAATLRGTT